MSTKDSKWTACFGLCYDIIAQSISVLDVTTDIWVCVKFYLDGRQTFFAISLTILLLALVSYTAAFVTIFDGSYRFRDRVTLFIVTLPLSPLLPFAFYYGDRAESFFNKLFECMRLGGSVRIRANQDTSTTSRASKFKQFFEKKIEKHFGFILESLVEGIYIHFLYFKIIQNCK